MATQNAINNKAYVFSSDTDITATNTVFATTFDTNVSASGVTLAGTTLSADGTEPNISINITAKGTGTVVIDELSLTTQLAVAQGGTGATTLTDNGVLYGNGTAAVDATAEGATGEVLVGSTGNPPAWSATPGSVTPITSVAALTFDTGVAAAGVTLAGTTLAADGTDVDIDININAKGAGHVIIDDLLLGTELVVAEGGTGAGTFTDHGVLLGSGVGAISVTAAGTTGQILTGSTGDDPAWTTATYPATAAIGTILIASAANTITTLAPNTAGYVLTDGGAGVAPSWQAATASLLPWSIKTIDLDPMVINNGYIANKAGLLSFTLPAACVVGAVFRIAGMNTAVGWRVVQLANQIIHFNGLTTTTGAGGYIEATAIHDSVELLCIVADLEFMVISSQGNITVA